MIGEEWIKIGYLITRNLSKIDPDISSDIYNKKVLQALNLNYKENFDDDVLIK